MGNNKKIAYSVYATNNYDEFKKLEGNRDVMNSRLNKIISSIRKVGWIRRMHQHEC